MKVKKYTNHEEYSISRRGSKTFNKDITVIQLEKAVDLNIYTPACLARTEDANNFVGKRALVYGEISSVSRDFLIIKIILLEGWGAETTLNGGPPVDKLKKVSVKVVSRKTCQTDMVKYIYERMNVFNQTVIKYNITEGMLCAGGVRGEDSCWGDSGGPLSYKTRGQHILIGAVSWGVECGLENKYGVYSSISYYRDWIEEKMVRPVYCGGSPNANVSVEITTPTPPTPKPIVPISPCPKYWNKKVCLRMGNSTGRFSMRRGNVYAINRKKKWGPVCNGSKWNDKAARVVCR